MNQTEVKKNQIQFYTYVLSILVLLAFGRTIGNNGLAYLIAGIESVSVLLVFVAGNIPDVLGKMIRYRRKRSRFIDAELYRKRVFYMQLCVSVVLFIIMLLLADVLANNLLQIANAGLIIRILAPILVIRMLESMFLGYFQSFGSHVQGVIVSVLRLLLFVIWGQILRKALMTYGGKVSSLLKNDDFYGMYGAVGLALAVLITEIIVLIVLFVFYMLSDRQYDKQKSKEGLQKSEDVRSALLGFGRMSLGGVGLRLLGFLFLFISLVLLQDKDSFGVFGGQYLLICSLPILLMCARFFHLYAKIIYAVKGQNGRQIRDMVGVGMQYTWCAGILAGVLLAVLSNQLAAGHFDAGPVLQKILPHGAFLIPLITMLVYLVMVNTAHNKVKECLLVMTGGLGVFILLSLFMRSRMESDVEAIVCAGWLSVGMTCIVLGIITVSKYRLQIEYVRTFLIPLVCVGIVGLVLFFLARFITPHIGNLVCFYVCLILGIIMYLVLLAVCRVFNEADLKQIYGNLGRKVLSAIFK